MMNVCFAEKSGLKRLGYIQNYNSYADELKKLISESFNYDVLNAFINDEIDNKRIYYYNKNFDPVSEDSNEKKYKIKIYPHYFDFKDLYINICKKVKEHNPEAYIDSRLLDYIDE